MLARRSASGAILLALAIATLHLASSSLTAAGREAVHFRLVKAKTVHLKDAKEARQFSQTLKSIGCECTHDDRHDVSYHCPRWKTLELKSHTVAHRWEAWLKKIGFETRHEH